MRRAVRGALALVVAVGAWGCGAGSAETEDGRSERQSRAAPSALTGIEMPAAGAAADFILTDTHGRSYDFLQETRGSVAMLFFGFTNCPDVCPVHMANLAAVLDQLPSRISRQVTVVFVTVDPQRDSPARVREWLDKFDRDFVGLIGDPERVRAIQLDLGLPPAVVQRDDAGDPNVGHAAHVMVFSRERDRRWVYPFGTRQSDWARDIPLLVEGAPPARPEES